MTKIATPSASTCLGTICMLALAAGAGGCARNSASADASRCCEDRAEIVPSAGPAIFTFARAEASAAHSATLAIFGEFPGVTHASALDPAENLRQVSFAAEGCDFDPALSPDGGTLYFASTAHRAKPDIYAKSIDGRSITQLTSDSSADAMPSVSPDGLRIAFASDRSGSWDIYVMNTTGGQAVQVTSDSTHELHPSWSPDGESLAFCKLGEVSARWEIWVTDAEQAGVQRFLTYGLFPDWHPESGKIAFQRARDRGDRLFSVWTLDYVRNEATNLTEVASSPAAALINPRWSRDGAFLAFAAIQNPEQAPFDQAPASADVWIMSAEGTGLSNLTGGHFANLMPTWGPGNTVYFVSDRAGRQNIWSSNSEQAMLAAGAISPAHAADERPSSHTAAEPTPSHTLGTPYFHQAAAPRSAPSAHQTAQPEQDAPSDPPDLANVPIDDQQQ